MNKQNLIKDKDNIINSILVSIFLAFLLGVFGPLTLFIGNINEFWFSIMDIYWILILGGLLLFSIAVIPCILFKGKGREFVICLVFGLALGFYIQGNYINANYGVLDGESIDWSLYKGIAIINTIAWVACIVLPFAIRYFVKKKWKQIIKFTCIFFILIQVLSLGILLITTDLNKNNSSAYLSTEGKLELSENNNVVIFVLDAFDSSFFNELINEYPDLKDKFKDFTYYPDTTGGATRTTAAIPTILTGQPWVEAVSYADYLINSYSRAELYDILKKYNYDTRIYTKSSFVPSTQIEIINNLTEGHGVVSSYKLLAKYMYKFTAFSYMPHLLKENFWFYTGVFDEIHSGGNEKSYVINDSQFYQDLLNDNISTIQEGNAFRLYHLLGAHPPFTLNEYAKEVNSNETSRLQQAKGSLCIIEEYINQLKKAGIYDNTNLVIMADHGNVNDEQNPVFMIKPFNTNKDFEINYAPISYYDFHSTLLALISDDFETYKNTIFDFKEGDSRTRSFYKLTSTNGTTITEYQINGPAWDKNSFSKTGNVYYGDTNSYTYDYKLGTTLSFGSIGNATKNILYGFSAGSSAGHTWTNATEAQMKFVLNKKPKSDLVVKINVIPYNDVGYQRMIASVGGNIVLDWSYSNTSHVEFAIPLELINDDEIVLDFRFPDAISPFELFGEGHDDRTLAFAFTNMSISEGIPENENVVYSYKLGEVIEFTEENDGTRYFMYGVSKINNNFVWTNGKQSGFIMDTGNINYDLECKINLIKVLNDTQKVIIESNGKVLYDNTVSTDNKIISFRVPADCIVEQKVVLNFSYPDAASPSELGINNDKRVLALALKSITFEHLIEP